MSFLGGQGVCLRSQGICFRESGYRHIVSPGVKSVDLCSVVPQIEDLAAEPEPEEMKGEFWVVFICSMSAPKQVGGL